MTTPAGHDHEHGHDDGDHDHDHGAHDHGHARGRGLIGQIRSVFTPHSHDAADSVDSALEASEKGIRAVKISLLGLLATSGLQLAVVLISGSVGLLADTIHNFSDALTAVPLYVAFVVGRRAATKPGSRTAPRQGIRQRCRRSPISRTARARPSTSRRVVRGLM